MAPDHTSGERLVTWASGRERRKGRGADVHHVRRKSDPHESRVRITRR
jgi:hypothetical protein